MNLDLVQGPTGSILLRQSTTTPPPSRGRYKYKYDRYETKKLSSLSRKVKNLKRKYNAGAQNPSAYFHHPQQTSSGLNIGGSRFDEELRKNERFFGATDVSKEIEVRIDKSNIMMLGPTGSGKNRQKNNLLTI